MLSDWEESDLTDLSGDDEDEYVPAPKKKAPPKVKDEYKASGSASLPVVASLTRLHVGGKPFEAISNNNLHGEESVWYVARSTPTPWCWVDPLPV